MENRIVYCDQCGEYLGDYVKGVLYKFGVAVTEPHICKGLSAREEVDADYEAMVADVRPTFK